MEKRNRTVCSWLSLELDPFNGQALYGKDHVPRINQRIPTKLSRQRVRHLWYMDSNELKQVTIDEAIVIQKLYQSIDMLDIY